MGVSLRAVAFGVLLGLVSMTGCATSRADFVVALPNGYQIIRDKNDAPMIIKRSGSKVIPGPVSRYTVIRDVVVGIVGDDKPPAEGTKPTGYFLINTRTGEIAKDLTEEAYIERLKALNINSAPELSPPVLPK